MPGRVAFYPWMSVRETLAYVASFREHWNRETEGTLLRQFQLDQAQKTSALSKGQRTQLALITAICAEPDLLVLDEPTSGLDPIVRREFIQTVIGAYQDGAPGRRTVFVSTHLISEFEGLIDEFTIIDRGREVLTLEADAARAQYQRIQVRFATEPGPLDFPQARTLRRHDVQHLDRDDLAHRRRAGRRRMDPSGGRRARGARSLAAGHGRRLCGGRRPRASSGSTPNSCSPCRGRCTGRATSRPRLRSGNS